MSRRLAQHLLVVDDGEERRLPIGGEALLPPGPNTERTERSAKRAICSSHSAFSEAGQTTNTR